MTETARGRLPEAPAEAACTNKTGQDFNDMLLRSGASAVADWIDGAPSHERILAIIEADDSPDATNPTRSVARAPHPTEGGAPRHGQNEGDLYPAENERRVNVDEISLEVLMACSQEPQNDTGNGQRLLHHFGADLLQVRNLGWHVWAGTHWEREGGNEMATRLAHRTASRIALEADVMAATPKEQAAIDAGEQARGTMLWIEKAKGQIDARKDQQWQMLSRIVAVGAEAQTALESRQTARRKYSVSSGNAGKIRGMLDQALPYRTVTVDGLDADALAFNVKNGTIRFVYDEVPDPDASDHSCRMLKRWRAVLTPHNRKDNITKVAPVEYIKEAHAPHFEEAVKRFLPIKPVREFVQRFHGYALTGMVGEQCFVFSYGTGANWKSTFVEIVSRIMGPYCATINFESLSGDQQRSGSGPSPDLARLPGARLVRASEPERGVQFKEALIKSLTGGEPMLVRSLNKEFFEMRPTFKMVLSGNHKPEIGGVDHGIWRRVKFVPWPVTIADHERRPMDEVMDEIWPERSGILNWLIAGTLDYLNGGLRTPAEVADATAQYRDEMDPVGTFVGACVESVPSKPNGSPASVVTARAMYDAFASWAVANAVRPWKEKSFATAMSQKGFIKNRVAAGVRYLHVALKNVPEAPRRRFEESPHSDDDIAPV